MKYQRYEIRMNLNKHATEFLFKYSIKQNVAELCHFVFFFLMRTKISHAIK